MAHHIYHTRGIILGSTPVKESNRFYKIFTEELGLIGTSAQSVRESKSKLRYILQDLSWISLDLVRGREVWRITSATADHVFTGLQRDHGQMKLLARVCSLVARLVHGEGRNDGLFEELVKITDFLERQTIPPDLHASFESLAALCVLVHLGYIDRGPYIRFLDTPVWTPELLKDFEEIRIMTIPIINTALSASQL